MRHFSICVGNSIGLTREGRPIHCEFWYDPLRRADFWSLARSGVTGLPSRGDVSFVTTGGRTTSLRGLRQGGLSAVSIQYHRSRLETRAKEYSMCASLRVLSKPGGAVKASDCGGGAFHTFSRRIRSNPLSRGGEDRLS